MAHLSFIARDDGQLHNFIHRPLAALKVRPDQRHPCTIGNDAVS